MSYNKTLSVNYQGAGNTHYANSLVPQTAKQIRESSGHPFISSAQQVAAIRNEWGGNIISTKADAMLYLPTPTGTFALFENNNGIATAYIFDAPTSDFEDQMALYMQQANAIREERGKHLLDWKTFGLTRGTALAEDIMHDSYQRGRVVQLGRVGIDPMITIDSDIGQQVVHAIFQEEAQPYLNNLRGKQGLIGKPKIAVIDPQSNRYEKIEPKQRMLLRRIKLGGMPNPDQFSYFDKPYRNEPRHQHVPKGASTIGHIFANTPLPAQGHYIATDIHPDKFVEITTQGSLERVLEQMAVNPGMSGQFPRIKSA